MTAKELAALCLRIRKLFGGEMDEEIWTLHRRWLRDKDHAICDAALEMYALDYGGAVGRFIPAKYREYYDRVSARAAERRRRAHDADEMRRIMELGMTGSDIEWARLRTDVRTADPARVEEAKVFLESMGWTRPDSDDPIHWSRSWVLAVVDIANDRSVQGIPARDFYRRTLPSRPRRS